MNRSWVEVSLGQIQTNYRSVQKLVGGGVAVMPVVKADAYRHGAVAVARALEQAGAKWLAVSNVQEGATLRDNGITARILVMADFLPTSRDAFFDYRLTPVVHDLAALPDWELRARTRSSEPGLGRFHLKLDTGMGRLGTRASAKAIASAFGKLHHAECEGLMTHFASSADFTSPQTEQQTAAFLSTRAALAESGISPQYWHLAATNPLTFGQKKTFGNMVRPGFCIYGYTSKGKGDVPPSALRVAPALSWKTVVLEVKRLPKNAPVGYGAMHRVQRDSRIAILAVGYADGFPHRLSNKGRVLIQGQSCPILGSVSMDVTTVDITDLASNKSSEAVKPGDTVTLLGRDGDEVIDAQQIARGAGTIAYAVLCGIHSRVARNFVA